MESKNFETDVLNFIAQFHGAEDVFLHGCCYWFAWMLSERFGFSIVYEPVEGHFMAFYMPNIMDTYGKMYDVRGDVTELYRGHTIYDMEFLKVIEPNLYQRLIENCRNFNYEA